jgi:hypothetical protein
MLTNPAVSLGLQVPPRRSPADTLYPIDQLRLSLAESRPYNTPGALPRLVLAVSTVKEFGCLGYRISHDLRLDRDTLRLQLQGVMPPEGDVCATVLGPATMSRELDLANGKYIVLVSYRKARDRLVLDISDTMTMVTGLDSSLVEADERPRWRYPRNSFVLQCNDQGAGFCDDVSGWLVKQSGISRDSFPPGGINPFRPQDYSDQGRVFYRYDQIGSFLRLRSCFSSIQAQIVEAVGVSASLETWRGERIDAVSDRALHERHIERPARVTDTPACQHAAP